MSSKYIAGVDEVGRGPLVGDVVTAAVILDPNNPIEGLTDSKKLSEKKRNALSAEIKQKALAWAIGRATELMPIPLARFPTTHLMKRPSTWSTGPARPSQSFGPCNQQ